MARLQNRLDEHDPGVFRQRFKILFVIVASVLSILLLRLWYLQIIQGYELRLKSENNSVRLRKIKPLRGLILDARGTVLVDNQPSYDILFLPNRVKNVQEVIGRLEGLYAKKNLPLSADPFPVNGRPLPFVPVKLEKNVSWEKLAIVETASLELPGVYVDVVPVRQYLTGEMMAHVIGYVGEVSKEELEKDTTGLYGLGDPIGKYGIEKHLDPLVKGKYGAEQVEVNAFGKEVRVVGKIEPTSGYSVILTIDAHLQKTAWDALGRRPGSVVVMDPRDGAVLAMVSSPSFDPNLFNRGISHGKWEALSSHPLHPMENRAISGQYPPGSTYKMIVASAALQDGIITPETTFYCDGTFSLGNRTYRCWNKNGHGKISLHRALVASCDVYFYNVGKLLGVDRLAWYAKSFGLGSGTGIDLPREKAGLIPTKAWKQSRMGEPWQAGETISISIGQGFNLVTPLQLATAYSAIANGGTIWRPYTIRRIERPDGRTHQTFGSKMRGKLPVTKENLDIVSYGLWGAVNEKGGTGSALKRKEEDVCGKTGTAQVVGLPDNEKARREKKLSAQFQDHALFVCFAPHKNPEIVVAVIVENAGHGGSVAAPVARKVIDAYFAQQKEKNRPQIAAVQATAESRGAN
jgi:penicillin-binding protein 2